MADAPNRPVRPVIIPDFITVHLGSPNNAAAQNVRVPFADYIANVASSEIYPTWPQAALVANIHAITTFALNRVYTEWYRSRGFNFDITNSTAYDQYYVHGRNIFANIRTIANAVFNQFIRREGFNNPIFSSYCNGTTSTCAGLSQWGTVTLANQGLTPLQILKRYYGNDIEIATSNNIRSIQESFPGTLRLGSTGTNVQLMQRYLNRIGVNFPLITKIANPNGTFDAQTESAVRVFQRTFGLLVDGIVGRGTWNKINSVFVGVVKLAELNSEGERIGIGTTPPTAVIKTGSRGENVLLLQFILDYISEFYDFIPYTTQDGVFGSQTDNTVREFQRNNGLTADGIVGPSTWRKLYEVFNSVKGTVPRPPDGGAQPPVTPPFPGTLLRVGSRGEDVRTLQRYLNLIQPSFPSIPRLVEDGIFGPITLQAVTTFQRLFDLAVDGIVGPITWNKLMSVYRSL
ncbi:MAG: peptidoglycan-binding protein [Firmicutes bacterium]|nr:peptidoglycan-binding protein [Bacillota bacterium]